MMVGKKLKHLSTFRMFARISWRSTNMITVNCTITIIHTVVFLRLAIGLPQQKMGSMGGTFTTPEFNSSYTITDSNLARIGDKHFLEKNHVLPPSI
jgi:uncharacterized membrane protein YkgB